MSYGSYKLAMMAIGAEPASEAAWKAKIEADPVVRLANTLLETLELVRSLGHQVIELQRRVAALEASSGGNTFHT